MDERPIVLNNVKGEGHGIRFMAISFHVGPTTSSQASSVVIAGLGPRVASDHGRAQGREPLRSPRRPKAQLAVS
jgi:hypothetical protein